MGKEKDRNVKIVNGVGNPATPVAWQEGDTVATILNRANIQLERGETATLGRKRIKDPATTRVRPGDTLVIAVKLHNG